jgi:uncharacterized protein (DUF2126 family)
MRRTIIPRISALLPTGKSAPVVIARAKTLASEIAANPTIFKTPNPPLAVFNAHISDAEVAQAAIATRTAGTVEIRDAKLRVLIDDLHTIKTYVEGIANADAATAPATIRAAGFLVRKAPSRTKQDLAVTQGAVSGSVIIAAKAAGKRASYDWQWSLDQKVWNDVAPTLQSRTSVSGLAVAVVHYFRYRAVIRAGVADWSEPVSLIVL